MNPRYGVCCRCKSEGDIIVKTLPSEGGLCSICNTKRLKDGKDKKPAAMSRKPSGKSEKPTGESVMFETIWNTRSRVSFITGLPLGMEARSFFFAHVLPKSTYPNYRLLMENVVLLTFDEHQSWDQKGRDALRSDPRWNKMFELERKLKEQYHNEEARKKGI